MLTPFKFRFKLRRYKKKRAHTINKQTRQASTCWCLCNAALQHANVLQNQFCGLLESLFSTCHFLRDVTGSIFIIMKFWQLLVTEIQPLEKSFSCFSCDETIEGSLKRLRFFSFTHKRKASACEYLCPYSIMGTSWVYEGLPTYFPISTAYTHF